MSFAAPLALLALLAIPLLILSLSRLGARQARAAASFADPALMASVAPRRPGRRRTIPAALVILAAVLLILGLAHPQHRVSVARQDGAVLLADDVSSSMAATDLKPTRLGAATRAASAFIARVPGALRVGVEEFNQRVVLLQSPTRDHAAATGALVGLHPGGHTAIGDALNSAADALQALKSASGRRPPGAIVLLSDGTSTTGADPLLAARRAASLHLPVYTVSVGTPYGTIPVPHGGRTSAEPVPVNGGELRQIASLSGARSFAAADSGGLSAVYAHLATQLGHERVQRSLTTPLLVAALLALALAAVTSLAWFGRII